MNNQTNAPLVIEFNDSVQLNQCTELSDLPGLEPIITSETVLTDIKGNRLARFPSTKVVSLLNSQKKRTLSLNHICFEGSRNDSSLLFCRIDRDDLDSLNLIEIPKLHIHKVLVDGNCVWPTRRNEISIQSATHTS